MKRFVGFIAAALAAGMALPALAQEACPKRGGTLTYSYTPEPVALSTLRTTGVPVAMISGKIYEGLLDYEGPTMTPRPGLARSWEVSEDSLTYTFHLRPGVQWHDGRPFTAADVKFSVERAIRPYHARGEVFFGDVASIETPDDLTVVFRLKRPVPFFMQAFVASSSPMLPKHLLEGVDTASREAVINAPLTAAQPVGTGPFRLKEWVRGSHITLERNPNYWQAGLPCLGAVVLRVIPDGAARAIALENGEIDLAPMNSVPDAEIQRLAALPQIEMSTRGTEALGTNMWLDLNLRSGPLADVRVRQAISMALDRKQIIDVIWYGHAVPSRGPLVSTNPFFDASLPEYPFDIRRANALLDEAGFRRGSNGVRFQIRQNFLPYGEKYVRLAEYVRQQLRRIGVDVTTESRDIGGWLKSVFTDWDYQMTSTFTDNRNDPTVGTERLFTTPYIRRGASFTNSMGYSNPRVDELFRLGAQEPDPAKRRAIFNEVQKILHDELPVIFLAELSNVSLWNRRVHGLVTNGLSYYSGWERVWKD
jgi:peptide/nickel transport system substrate-binding protein